MGSKEIHIVALR